MLALKRNMEEKFMLRLSDGMSEQARNTTAQNRRSMNSEIGTMLKRQVQQQLDEVMRASLCTEIGQSDLRRKLAARAGVE